MTAEDFTTRLAEIGVDISWLKARTVEEGECWIWMECTSNGYPQANLRKLQAHPVLVRRIAAALAGRAPEAGQPVRMKCRCKQCVNPAHATPSSTKEIGRMAAKRGAWKGVVRAAKISAARLKTSTIDADAVTAVKMAERGTLQAVCEQYGVAYSTAKAIRSGRIRRDYSSPWAGMGART